MFCNDVRHSHFLKCRSPLYKHKQMGIIIVIATISILIASGFLIAFLWGSKNGQFDDYISPPNRILFDNNKLPESETKH
jgi:cbb3-type cytochrome oxidase maturation protein